MADTDKRTVDFSSSTTTFTWQAQAVQDAGLGNKMYFAIENSNDISCNGCVVKTPGFYVTDVRPAGGSYSSSMSTAISTSSQTAAAGQTNPSSTASSASQTTANGQSSQTPQAAASTGDQNPSSAAHKSHSNAVGLGVGLGVGLAVLFALLALLLICLRRRRNKKRESFNYRPTGSGNWTQDETPPNNEMAPAPEPKSMVDMNRESGVLGGTAVAGLASQSRHSDLSHVSNPFRPSTAASRLSHASWIEPFDFEKPGVQQSDEMSQLRNSVNTDGAVQAESTARADDASSHYSEGPEVFGPESPSDAAVVASPSSYISGFNRQSADWPIRGSGSVSASDVPRKPVPAKVADGRDWPLP